MERHNTSNSFKALLSIGLLSLFLLLGQVYAQEEIIQKDSKVNVSTKNENIYIRTIPTPLGQNLALNFALNFDIFHQIDKDNFPPVIETTFQSQKPYDFNLNKYLQKEYKTNRLEESLYTSSLVTLTLLNVADYITTTNALKHEGLQEGNPVLKPFTKNQAVFATVKFGLTTANYYLLKKLHKKNKKLAWAISIASNIALSYVVVHNVQLIQKAQAR